METTRYFDMATDYGRRRRSREKGKCREAQADSM
jgi:hypothetical protein